ncbi:SDR family NAD(P)-dependent oxidoreductase [Iamia sp.]|uniref:SDR family NAD(P)-dependent oxidoreductase n=1 Tax=Iamia sp. TaxID=2722710 RepID=UPI002B9C7394|nr:SDR family NAD(P)-dependent oxidoreductase [Iamia sp.]HXH57969.1 SDR family NAD(P)-dependent oxidoreductase [Iamia sp.]
MADLGYDGKVAIITGAGGGLGRSHALELARRGALVVVNDLGGSVGGEGGSHTAAQQVVDEVTAAGGEAVASYDSVATPEGGRAIVATALDTFERVDIVINNAGILRDAAFKNMDAEKLEPVIDVHLKGAFYVTQAAWGPMRDQGYGRIVNTSSAAGLFGNFGQTNYGAAKAGLVGLTRVLAVEGAKSNIVANAIAPVAKTRMTEELLGAMADKLDPAFITPVVAWLAHEDVPVTGEVYSCGGGHVARVFTGVTQGWTDTESLTVEDIRDHFDEIRDTDGYMVPANLTEELMATLKALGG